jgi:hypothetical protein
MMRWSRFVGTAVLVTVTLAAVAMPAVGASGRGSVRRAAAGAAEAVTYVGRVPGLDASLAVVVEDDAAFAYLCDGAAVSEWFRGPVDTGAVVLESPDGSRLAAARDGSRLVGFVFTGGERAKFSLKRASGEAGLFRAEQVIDGVGYAAGWVTQPDGSTLGQVSLANVAGARVLEAPPVLATTPTTAAATAVVAQVGVVAPPAVVAAFPAAPPPDSQVTVVPFSNQADTAEGGGTGGGGTSDTAPPTVGTPPTPVPESCGSLRSRIDGTHDLLNTTVRALDEATSRKQRRALQIQVNGIQRQLRALEALSDASGC